MIRQILSSLSAERRWSVRSRGLKGASYGEYERLRPFLAAGDLGRHLGIRNDLSFEGFRSRIPITDYERLTPWIDRVREGEANVLWPGRPIAYVTTSGTTEAAKLVPISRDFLRDYHLGNAVTYHRVIRRIPGLLRGRILTLGGPICEGSIQSIPVGSITGLLYNTLPWQLRVFLALPSRLSDTSNYDERLYLTARLALLQQITGIIAVTPGSLVVLSSYLAEHGARLVSDIETGHTGALTTVPPSLRPWLKTRLRPNRGRAGVLKAVLRTKGLLRPKDVWPVRGVCCYLEELHPIQMQLITEAYGDVRFLDPGILASEGRVSVGVNLDTSASAVIPLGGLVELAPCCGFDRLSASEIRETVLPHELEVGQHYTPVITTSGGFIRYHLPDVLQVSSKVGDLAFVKFIGRLDGSISASGEKVSDAQLRVILGKLLADRKVVYGRWYVKVDWASTEPHYVLFVETEGLPSRVAMEFESLLTQVNVSYRRKREQRLLGEAKVLAVKPGTLGANDEKSRWLGQFKEPHMATCSKGSQPGRVG